MPNYETLPMAARMSYRMVYIPNDDIISGEEEREALYEHMSMMLDGLNYPG